MVVFQVYVVEFAPFDVDAECQTAVLHVVEKRQHFAEHVYRIGRHAFRDIARVECLQTLVDEASYFHLTDCSP